MRKLVIKYYISVFLKYFIQGLLYMAPAAVTIWVVYKVFVSIDTLLPFKIPGLGIIVIVTVISVLGYVGSTFIANPIFALIEGIIEKAPVINTIYTSVKDIVKAFVGKNKKFNEPVLVKINMESELQKLGFITQHDLKTLGIGEEMIAVYLPHSYAFSGNLFITPKKNITPIEASAADVMRFIVSGGVINIGEKTENEK
ncbi:MAG: DUF502 domain-containing protein [Bacteroidota bacterium]|nr:DUF502 domain-containing protein [Bacteroidota bacterium]